MSEHKSLSFTRARLPTDPTLASSLFFGGMLEGGSLKRNEAQFGRDYEVCSYSTGEFDERLFVSDFESQIGSPSRLSSQSRRCNPFAHSSFSFCLAALVFAALHGSVCVMRNVDVNYF